MSSGRSLIAVRRCESAPDRAAVVGRGCAGSPRGEYPDFGDGWPRLKLGVVRCRPIASRPNCSTSRRVSDRLRGGSGRYHRHRACLRKGCTATRGGHCSSAELVVRKLVLPVCLWGPGAAGSNTAVLIGFAETPQARACGVHVRVFHLTLDPVLLVPNDGATERQRSTRTTWYSTAGPRGTLNRALTA